MKMQTYFSSFCIQCTMEVRKAYAVVLTVIEEKHVETQQENGRVYCRTDVIW